MTATHRQQSDTFSFIQNPFTNHYPPLSFSPTQVQAAYADVQAAVQKQDAAALKSSWATYFKTAGLDKTNPFTKKDRGQALSSDFAYTLKNSNFQDEP